MPTVALVATTKVSAVTNAAVTASVSPEMATALVTMTVPEVLPPTALNSAAVIGCVGIADGDRCSGCSDLGVIASRQRT